MTATGTIQASILKVLGVDSTDTTLLARSLEWLNEALDDAQMYLPEAEFFKTSEISMALVVNQTTYALPSDFVAFSSQQIRNDDESMIIDIINKEQFDRNHPDPSSETAAPPYDATLEFDRDNARNIIRLAPKPDATDTIYANMILWHPALSASQDIQWSKLEGALKRRAAYYGSLEIFAENEYVNFRQELDALSMAKFKALQQVVAIQKPRPKQIPIIMKKSYY